MLWNFVRDNPEPIQLRVWIWRSLEMPTGLIAIAIFVGGILLSSLLFFSVLASSSFEKRRLRREIDALQKMIKENLTQAHQK